MTEYWVFPQRVKPLRKNSHHVIPKGGVCPRNLLDLEAEKESRFLASLGMTEMVDFFRSL
jgi:hypothetical protein